MEEVKKPGPWNTAFKWGIIAGIASVILGFVRTMNLDWSSFEAITADQSSFLYYVTFLFLLAGIIIAQMEHRRKDLGGYASYGRMVGVATIVALAFGLCEGIHDGISVGFIHPEMVDTVIEGTIAKMGDISEKQEEDTISMMRWFFKPAPVMIIVVLRFVFFGVLMGLISSIFIHKNDPNPDYN